MHTVRLITVLRYTCNPSSMAAIGINKQTIIVDAHSLSDKHEADPVMLKKISEIPYMKRLWGTTADKALMKSKVKLDLGNKPKNGKGRRVKKNHGRQN